MTDINDFKDENGKVDWKRYNIAEIESGERCYQCNSFIGIFVSGSGKRQCYTVNTK